MSNRTVLFDFSGVISDPFALAQGIDETVRRIAEDHRLVIVSQAPESAIVPFLESRDLRKYFDSIFDGDLQLNKSAKIGMVFEQYNIGPRDCVMITDSKDDILQARDKDVECIAVTWGFNDYDMLLSGNPFRIVRLPDEIPNAVTEFYHGKGTTA